MLGRTSAILPRGPEEEVLEGGPLLRYFFNFSTERSLCDRFVLRVKFCACSDLKRVSNCEDGQTVEGQRLEL